MDKPVISVVTVVRNDLADLKSTIDSVAQASDLFEDFEHIIIDGDSTDGTREFLQSFRPDYRHRAISEPDAGIFDAMNKANRYVTGEY
ncbi:glycosyltransferase, partial [Acinetobacter baumannii]